MGLPRDNGAAEARTLDSLCLEAPQVLPLEFSDFQLYMQSTLLHFMQLTYITYSLHSQSRYLASHGNIPETLREGQISDSNFLKNKLFNAQHSTYSLTVSHSVFAFQITNIRQMVTKKTTTNQQPTLNSLG